jgi:anti-sigma regulatory factor (Ser/Thr protein kinase)
MSDSRTIEMSLPGLLRLRNLALRVVMEACKLVGTIDMPIHGLRDESHDHADSALHMSDRFEFEDEFAIELVSAFSEIFNNIHIHAYEGRGDGLIELVIHVGRDSLIVEITDTGKSFNIEDVTEPDELPVGGMGIHIARAMLDELHYQPGPPNHWRLVKYRRERRD